MLEGKMAEAKALLEKLRHEPAVAAQAEENIRQIDGQQ